MLIQPTALTLFLAATTEQHVAPEVVGIEEQFLQVQVAFGKH